MLENKKSISDVLKPATRRLLFQCAYDGLGFHGWQSQPCGKGVQDYIERAIAAIFPSSMRIAASGRTDAGVHAHAQYFHLDVPQSLKMDAKRWRAALNTHLPPTIRILHVCAVDSDFHARFHALAKTYEYHIDSAAILSPFLLNRCWHLHKPFDVDLFEATLSHYLGRHDLRMFAGRRINEPKPPPPNYFVREIYEASMQREGTHLLLRFRGSGFMYRMVRLLVGASHYVARGGMTLAEHKAMIDSPSLTEKSRYCAPAHGLYLSGVDYPVHLLQMESHGALHDNMTAPK